VGLGKFLANDILTTSIILYRVLRSEPAKWRDLWQRNISCAKSWLCLRSAALN